MSACTPASPDHSEWAVRQVGGVTISVPPGYVVEQGPPYNILIRSVTRRTQLFLMVLEAPAARKEYDSWYFRQTQKRNVCRASLSGYPAEVIGTFNAGKFELVGWWEAVWSGEDTGKWLMARLSSTRLDEARDLRAVLHTIRPKATERGELGAVQ